MESDKKRNIKHCTNIYDIFWNHFVSLAFLITFCENKIKVLRGLPENWWWLVYLVEFYLQTKKERKSATMLAKKMWYLDLKSNFFWSFEGYDKKWGKPFYLEPRNWNGLWMKWWEIVEKWLNVEVNEGCDHNPFVDRVMMLCVNWRI